MSDTPDPGPATAVLPPHFTVAEVAALLDPAAQTPQSAADAPIRDTPPEPPVAPETPPPGAPGPPRGRNGPVRGPVVVAWLVDASRVCGDWLSLAATAATRTVTLTLADEAAFAKWCNHLNVPTRRRTAHTDELGRYLQAVTTAHGWTITVHLHNPTPQETRR